jgi:hypothetical protein
MIWKVCSLALLVIVLMSCHDPKKAKLTIVNKLTNISLDEVYWGDFVLGYRMDPGEQVTYTFSDASQKDWHYKTHVLMIKFSGSNASTWLRTRDSVQVLDGDDQTIIISDSTVLLK